MPANDLAGQAEQTLKTAEDAINDLLRQKRGAEAKVAVTDAERDLRDIKRQLADEQREVRASFTDARLQVSGTGQVVGMFAGGKARAAMARGRAMDKRKLAGNQAATLRPYAEVKAYIDKAWRNLDRVKAQITQTLADDRQQSVSDRAAAKAVTSTKPPRSPSNAESVHQSTPPPEAPPPPPPPTPATWAPDPYGRSELRYWDGIRWTEHVVRSGQQSVDPPE